MIKAFLLCGIALAGPAFAQERAIGVGCPDISVASLDRSVSFYADVLSFSVKRIDDTSAAARLAPGAMPTVRARSARLDLGEECISLTEYRRPAGKPYFADSRANDSWFQHVAIVVSDMAEAYARLRKAGVRLVSSSPQTLPEWNVEAAGISALYFRDPDGHYLELIHFPSGKGQAKWQASSAKTFLGIDHTAIAVSSTQRSLSFYQDELHFRRTGGSENYGNEQEHLSGVFNAHVVITSLRSGAGIGIELLEYLTPSSGRPIPQSLRLEDLACWQTPVEVRESPPMSDDKRAPRVKWVKLPPNAGSYREAAWISDPDGHRLELVKK